MTTTPTVYRRMVVSATNTPDIDNAAGTAEFFPGGEAWRLQRIGFIATTAVANAAGTVSVKVYRRPVAGSASNQVELAEITLMATTTIAAGKGVFFDFGHASTTATLFGPHDAEIFKNAMPLPVIKPGESLFLDVENESDSGVVYSFVDYHAAPLVALDDANMTDVT